jgi:hypothetical protein
MYDISPEHNWIKRMLSHLKSIIRTNLGIQFQSSFYFDEQLQLPGIVFQERSMAKAQYAPKKHMKPMKSQSLMNDCITLTSEQDLKISGSTRKEDCKYPLYSYPRLHIVNAFDETGYQTLELERDSFLSKINLIKRHLEREDHPLAQFIRSFDQEFSDYYEIFLSHSKYNNSKLSHVS